MGQDNNWQQVDRPVEGQAICFDLRASMRLPDGQTIALQEQGFVLCFQGELRAWRNHCPHAGSPLDWIPGQFFSEDGQQLVCHTHGAHFEPLSGACLSGPCPRGLYSLECQDLGNAVLVPVCVEITKAL
ncbi:MAG: Rieske 2Fe-2S domain-containing protein [Mariprofundus sp.]|nr:Rieske 2Fe-2S domain-containing protein [Mariprofundus sp.]